MTTLTSKPPRYACFGGPLDGNLVNEKWTPEGPAAFITYEGRGRYVLQRNAQGFNKDGEGLHTYVWEDG